MAIKYVKMGVLTNGTEFEYEGVTYKKDTGFCRGDEVECSPKYGGQWQNSMKEWLHIDTVVCIKT